MSLANARLEVDMARQPESQPEVVPIPGEDNEAERERVRTSNDRDQRRERDGLPSKHNRGYDEAARGVPQPPVDRVTDE